MKEINHLALVDMIGIDRDDRGEFYAYFQVLNPTSLAARNSGPTKAAVYTYKFEALNPGLITERTIGRMSRKLYTSHLQCYISTEREARHGLMELSNFLDNFPDRRTNVYFAITDESLSRVTNSVTLLDRIPGRSIRRILDLQAKSWDMGVYPIRIKDIILNIPFSRPNIIPIVRYFGKQPAARSERLENISAGEDIFGVTGGAVFLHAKMVGKLDNEMSKLFYALNGFSRRSNEVITLHGESVNLEMNNIRIDRKWKSSNTMVIRIYTELGITYNNQKRKLTLKNINEISTAFNEYYKETGDNFVQYSQDHHWDLLGIGDTRRGYGKWEDITVDFEVHSKVITKGNLITPYE
ncbi:hypothetical protein GQF01_14225 [Paenibacillus sp. 5J-6]|uniref:Ger(X)C family spore germination protein n=1 Tax=Paenibacillus silvestris TaxID=2606219 RepID=A0A6L8UYH0_9BACL|nr:Ger(x)C family spore germination C-terminal domain-containing protein [Paenibacillus silvestris]MZQ83268.1 hypothetical protein [Paenibacillus silvestris]